MQTLLSLENAPPLAAPLRFFVSAPLFAVLAGLLLAATGEDAFASRWMPAALAATHLITVGFMLQAMLGALVQILPVVAGANLERPLRVAGLVHAGLSAGTLALAAAFLLGSATAFVVAAALLGATALFFVAAAARALHGVPSTSPTIRGLKLALAGLLGVAGLGVLMALALARGWMLPLPPMADLHAAWGLGAWSGVLLAAVAYVVVPMFQLTPAYPARFGWLFPPLVLALLAAWSAAFALGFAELLRPAQAFAALAGIGFAAFTLRLQAQRRRARADATHRYWQGGLACVIAALAMLLLAAIHPPLADQPGWPGLFGILFGVGGFMSFIVGMLYKIVPFLSWLHLQNAGQGRVAMPNMNKILAEGRMRWQMRAHFAALALLAAAALRPDWLARPAGLAFAGSSAWLLANLLAALAVYRRHLAAVEAKPAP